MCNRLPILTRCCGCVTDLKTAVILIAVYGIATCPPVSWALMRHTYIIRISCLASMNTSHQEVVDINFRNMISFGLGVNAGFDNYCHKPDSSNKTKPKENVLRFNIHIDMGDNYMVFIKHLVWIVFIVDLAFLVASIAFLYKVLTVMNKKIFDVFMYSVIVSVIVSFIYSFLYVFACASSGVGFPIFEFLFAFVDLIVWTYFILVIRSYRNMILPSINTSPISTR